MSTKKIPVFLITFMLAVTLLVSFAAAEGDAATLSTDKPDYSPGDTVHITGGGFVAGNGYVLPVLRPDGTIVKGDGSFTPGWDTVTADASGNLAYDYQLDGIFGTYEVRAYPSDWSGDWNLAPLASVTFTDSPSANLDQCRNGPADTPNDCIDLGGGTGWVNGNAGKQTSHFI
ncbi:MAG: hypothetical protein P8Y14_25460, partial [Anaerolineales bacterium]